MVGDGQLQRAPLESVLSADVLSVGMGQPLSGQPLDDLVVGDHQCPGSVSHLDGVTHVVAVPVAEDDHVGGHVFCRRRRGGVAGQERVAQIGRASCRERV